ncbi:MAG: hypothetical protein FWF29_02765 [Treponema sp.]|nr:hypothetical protein [Treponema sp.]
MPAEGAGWALPEKHSRLSGGADAGEKVGKETEEIPYSAKDTRTRRILKQAKTPV